MARDLGKVACHNRSSQISKGAKSKKKLVSETGRFRVAGKKSLVKRRERVEMLQKKSIEENKEKETEEKLKEGESNE